MPYMPTELLQETEFPQEWGKDVKTQMRLIDEQYKRFYPLITYYCLRIATTPANPTAPNTPDMNAMTGEPTNSKFDPLWGESVDPALTVWKQPQLSAVVDPLHPVQANDVEVFENPVRFWLRFQRENYEKELKKYGFDQVRSALCFVPLWYYDMYNLTAHPSDKFLWDDDWYIVKQIERVGFWKNTNLRLFMVLNVEHLRPKA